MSRKPLVPNQKNQLIKSKSNQDQEISNLIQQGLILHSRGKISDAKVIYEQVLKKNSSHFNALQLLGAAYAQENKAEIALQYLNKAIKINKTNAVALNNRGFVLKTLKRFEEALDSFTQALKFKPDYVDAAYNRGLTLQELRRFDEAIETYNQILIKNPAHADALNNRGIALRELNRFDEAIASYNQALNIKPDFAEAFNNRGNTLKELKRFEEALENYNQAIQCKSNYAEAFFNRGIVLKQIKKFNEALECFDQAVCIKPDYAEAFSNKGLTLQEMKCFDEALNCYNKALFFKPNYSDAFNDKGNILKELGYFEEALKNYDQALTASPNNINAIWNKSLLLILIGKYSEGWSLYESRLVKEDTGHLYYKLPQLSWRGTDDLKDKTLLIYGEQGLGDVIQFVRYLKKINEHGIKTILEVPKTLVSIISTLDVPLTLIEKGLKLPDFDAHCPLLSLPYVFKTTVDTIPNSIPYLFSNQEKVFKWKEQLGSLNRKRVGLVWSGSSKHNNDHNRSIQLELFSDILKLPFEWHSLQKEYRDSDKEFLSSNTQIHQHDVQLSDFSDTAALIDCMDLVISVDTSVAHLAGALGKEVWILLPHVPDYRWMLNRNDSPWYPTAKLFRQDSSKNWGGVLNQIKQKLLSKI